MGTEARSIGIWLNDHRDDGHEENHLRVLRIQNSLEYRIGEYLSEATVQELIDKGWAVFISRQD